MEPNPYNLASLWQQSDWVIRLVALTLLAMSLASWSVIVLKASQLQRYKKRHLQSHGFWQAPNLQQGMQHLHTQATRHNPFMELVHTGQKTVNHHSQHPGELQHTINLSDWLAESLRSVIDESSDRFHSGMTLLASVGSTAPFVGLFGTVWGVYHALSAMGHSAQATLGQIAGPVGEALVMTAFGLVVAVPAVLGYNALARANSRLLGQLNRFARQLHTFFLTGKPLEQRP